MRPTLFVSTGALIVGVLSQLRTIIAGVGPQIIQTHNGKSHLLIRAQKAVRANRLWFCFQHGYQDTDTSPLIPNC